MVATTDERLLLTVEEAARRLGIGRTLAWRLVQERELPSVRVGRCVRVPLRDLEAWVEEQRQDKPR
jgi:excisionase family DNA binding protein